MLNVQYGAPPVVQQDIATTEARHYPIIASQLVGRQWLNQPRNLVLRQQNTAAIQEVIPGLWFAVTQQPNLNVPIQQNRTRASLIMGWVARQIGAVQGKLPGSP